MSCVLLLCGSAGSAPRLLLAHSHFLKVTVKHPLLITLLIALPLASAPLLSHAQAYKCKQANGVVSFQETPCPDAKGTAIALKAPAPSGDVEAAPGKSATNRKNASGKTPSQLGERDYLTRRDKEDVRAYNQGVKAHNQQIACNNARQQLGVAKSQRPIYRNDSAGERQFVSDDNRQSEISAADSRVAQACQ